MRSPTTRSWLAGLALLTMAASTGCEEDGPAEAVPSSSTDVVARDLADVAVVHDDRLVFPRAMVDEELRAKIAAWADAAARGEEEGVEPVFLVGDRASDVVRDDGTLDEGAGNPQGFMRRALSLREEGDDVVIATAPASLEEVFTELEANGQVDIGAGPTGDGPPGKEAQGRARIEAPTIPLIDLSGVEIYRDGDDYIRLSSAYVHLDLAVDVGVEVSMLRLQESHVVVSGDIATELAIEASMLNTPPTAGLPIMREVFAAKYPLPPLGPVPMTIALRLSAGCTISGGGFHVSGGAGTTISFHGGVEYTRAAGVLPVGGVGVDPYVITPTAELLTEKQLTTRCAIEPRIEVLLYDVAGPMVKANAFTDFRFQTSPAELGVDVGVDGHLGGTLRVFGYKIGDLSAQIFDHRAEVWSMPLE